MNRCIYLPLLLAAILCAGTASAQDEATKEVIARYPKENAIVWNNHEHVTISYKNGELVSESDVHEERLILNKQAAGLYSSDYVYHSYFHPLEGDIEAATLIPDGDRYRSIRATDMKTTHSEGENVFYDDTKVTKITFGNLGENTRTKLDYTIRHRDIHFLPSYYFESGMPIRVATFSVTAPRSVVLKYILQGSNTDKIKYTTEEGRSDVTYTWQVRDMPRYRSFEDAPEAPYYIPHVLVYVASYTPKGADAPVPVFSTVADLYRFYYPFIRSINQHEDDSLNAVVADVTRAAKTPRAKAEAIYGWVQGHIRYVAFEDSLGGFIPREAARVCSRRFGDCKDMTSLLVQMCRKAGLDAHFCWIGTRHKPYKYEEVPLPVVDNHMICALQLNGEWIFMDGTDPVIPFSNPPYMLQGKEALVAIDEHNYKIVTVPVAPASKNAVVDSTRIQLTGSSLAGDVQINYKGYGAWRMASMLRYRSEEEQEKAVESLTSRGSNKYQQDGWSTSSAPDASKDFVLKSHFKLDDYVRNAGKEYYVNLNLKRSYEDDYAEVAERQSAIEHSFNTSTREVVLLDIPKGYHVTYLPPDKEERVPGLWSYSIHYQKTGTQVKLIKEFSQDALYVQPAQFGAHNKLVDALRAEYRESIVLTAN